MQLWFVDKLKLFFYKSVRHCLPCKPSRRMKKLMKIYIVGSQRLLDHLDVANLIKTMRSNKIMLDNIVVNDDIEHKILHMDKNIIDICDYKKNALLEAFNAAF